MGPELQILIVTVLFLGLLTAGMAVPFAIAVPAVIYLLMQGGFTALNGLGLMSWGSMNTFALTAVPLFMFMADILSVSGLIQPHLQRPRQAGGAAARRAAANQYRRLRDLRLGERIEHRDRGLDRRRRAAAAHQPQLQSRARGRIARGRRHARHSDPAELPDDHLRHLHRNLGAEAVHRRRGPRPDHDRPVHALHRDPRADRAQRRAEGAGRALAARGYRARLGTSRRSSC